MQSKKDYLLERSNTYIEIGVRQVFLVGEDKKVVKMKSVVDIRPIEDDIYADDLFYCDAKFDIIEDAEALIKLLDESLEIDYNLPDHKKLGDILSWSVDEETNELSVEGLTLNFSPYVHEWRRIKFFKNKFIKLGYTLEDITEAVISGCKRDIDVRKFLEEKYKLKV